MGLEDFRTPRSDWMKELESQVEGRGLSVSYSHVAANSHHFKIEGVGTCAVGKTHHTREEERTGHHINLNAVEEANWRRDPQRIPSTIKSGHELADIFGIVVDHRSTNGYQQNQDNFLVLTEDILKEIPESGKKEFRSTTTGYRHPFDKHLNSWRRLFQNIQ
jgi:hypothetical protein